MEYPVFSQKVVSGFEFIDEFANTIELWSNPRGCLSFCITVVRRGEY